MTDPDGSQTAPATSAVDRPPGRHLVLVGPTAVGKSSVAMALARRRLTRDCRPVEIVSCDSMQVYRGMDIGTASPTARDRTDVPHHLVDVADPSEEFSVSLFRDLVDGALDDIESRGADAILVGGTGLYLRAITDGLSLPARYPEVAAALEAEPDTAVLVARLEALDPVALTRIPPNNRRRVIRALEVTVGSGRPFSAAGPGLGTYPPTPFVLTGLRLPREVVARRIEERYRAQMEAGFLEEVRLLESSPRGLSRTAAEALGYRELRAHLRGECGLDEALGSAVTRTRRFAVRQERWFRRDPRIRWFDVPEADTGERPDAGAEGVLDRIDRWWSQLAADGIGSATTVDVGEAPSGRPV